MLWFIQVGLNILIFYLTEEKAVLNFLLNAERWTLNAERWTLNAERWTLNAERWTLNAERWTLNAERFFFPIKKAWKNQAFCISDKPAVPLTGLWA